MNGHVSNMPTNPNPHPHNLRQRQRRQLTPQKQSISGAPTTPRSPKSNNRRDDVNTLPSPVKEEKEAIDEHSIINDQGTIVSSSPTNSNANSFTPSVSIHALPDPVTSSEVQTLQAKLKISKFIEHSLLRERRTLRTQVACDKAHLSYLQSKCHTLESDIAYYQSIHNRSMATIDKLRTQNSSFLPLVSSLKKQIASLKPNNNNNNNNNNDNGTNTRRNNNSPSNSKNDSNNNSNKNSNNNSNNNIYNNHGSSNSVINQNELVDLLKSFNINLNTNIKTTNSDDLIKLVCKHIKFSYTKLKHNYDALINVEKTGNDSLKQVKEQWLQEKFLNDQLKDELNKSRKNYQNQVQKLQYTVDNLQHENDVIQKTYPSALPLRSFPINDDSKQVQNRKSTAAKKCSDDRKKVDEIHNKDIVKHLLEEENQDGHLDGLMAPVPLEALTPSSSRALRRNSSSNIKKSSASKINERNSKVNRRKTVGDVQEEKSKSIKQVTAIKADSVVDENDHSSVRQLRKRRIGHNTSNTVNENVALNDKINEPLKKSRRINTSNNNANPNSSNDFHVTKGNNPASSNHEASGNTADSACGSTKRVLRSTRSNSSATAQTVLEGEDTLNLRKKKRASSNIDNDGDSKKNLESRRSSRNI